MIRSLSLLLVLSPLVPLSHLPAAPMVDEVKFGNTASEASHEFQSSESESQIISGLLGESARVLLPLDPETWHGGKLSFRLKVDPEKLNYITIRLSGTEANTNNLILYCDGKQIGYRHLGDVEILDLGCEEPNYNGRFYYKTSPLPLALTNGKTSLACEIQANGQIWGYGVNFEQYQKPMKSPSRGIYAIYSHTDGYFTPPQDEQQGTPPGVLPTRTEPGEEVLEQVKNRVLKTVQGTFKDARPWGQQSLHFMVRASFIPWTGVRENPQLVSKVVQSLDELLHRFKRDAKTAQSDPGMYNGDWFGLGPAADALRLMAEPVKPFLDEEIDDGIGGKIKRRDGWLEMLLESRDWHRRNRRLYTNQTMIVDMNIYRANRGIATLDPARALPETAALRYLHEAVGLEPWLGSETDAGPNRSMGDHYLQLTDKGLTKELGFVGYYGEVLDWIAQIYDSTRMPGQPGDAAIKSRLEKAAAARALFRYPMADSEGFRAMRAETVVGWRDVHYPGDVTYAQRPSWDASALQIAAITKNASIIGHARQMLADNQFFASVKDQLQETNLRTTAGMLEIPDQYDFIKSQANSWRPLPMTAGQPDFAWADEEDGVLAIKRGDEILYMSLYWRSRNAVNSLARIHQMEPRLSRVAVVQEETKFTPSGMTWKRPDWTNMAFANGGHRYPDKMHSAAAGEELPIAKIPEGVAYKQGQESIHAGKASFYQLQYGPWLVGMNTTADQQFTLTLPPDAPAQSREWITGKMMSLKDPLVVKPRSTLVFWLPSLAEATGTTAAKTASQQPTKMSPTIPSPLTVESWNAHRAPLLAMLKEQMYGAMPGRPEKMRCEVVETEPNALSGLATRKQIAVLFDGRSDGPRMELLLYIPNATPHPPVILGLNFWGNHSVNADAGIRLSDRWIESGKNPWCDVSGVKDHRATDACRGTNAKMWQVEELMKRGYALATAYRGDIAWDDSENDLTGRQGDVFSLFPELQKDTNANFSVIGAWAWALQRGLDYLETDPMVDSTKVAAFGWSRLGKAALWAGASDPRFAMVLPHQSGAGGAKLLRRGNGESITRLTTLFPHWFCRLFRMWKERGELLPWDQDEVLGLIAPRPLCLGTAEDDRNSDPEGEFYAALSASSIFKTQGAPGLSTNKMPAAGAPAIEGNPGYFIRTGTHEVTAEDWNNYLTFADRWWKKK